MTDRVMLVHGGFMPETTAAWFWTGPGVTPRLAAKGFGVAAPDRAPQPCTWVDEASHLAAKLSRPCIVVAGSNGCSVALRMAIDHSRRVKALVLCWPATAGDVRADEVGRRHLQAAGLADGHISALFTGGTIRGVADGEIKRLTLPVVIVPSDPPNPTHQEHTVNELADLLPAAEIGPAFPETPTPMFPPRRDAFVAELASILNRLSG